MYYGYMGVCIMSVWGMYNECMVYVLWCMGYVLWVHGVCIMSVWGYVFWVYGGMCSPLSIEHILVPPLHGRNVVILSLPVVGQ